MILQYESIFISEDYLVQMHTESRMCIKKSGDVDIRILKLFMVEKISNGCVCLILELFFLKG